MTYKKAYDEAAAQAEGTNLSTTGIRFAEQAADPVVPPDTLDGDVVLESIHVDVTSWRP